MAEQKAALGGLDRGFDPNPACVQRQHGRRSTAAVGGPRGPRELEEGELALGEAAKPAKLQTSAGKRRQISRLAQAFQHRPSNMPRQARREARFSAIPEIRRPPRLVDQVPAELERDRRPKLLPRTRSCTLQIGISGL